MTTLAIGVVLGPPVASSAVPVTISNLGAQITTAQNDVATVVTDTTAADNDVATLVTDTTTADNDLAALVTSIASVVADMVTCFNSTAGPGLMATINADNAGSYVYNNSTLQVSPTTAGGALSIDATNAHLFFVNLNTLGAAITALQTAIGTAKTATATAKTDAATAKTATATAKADAATANTAA
jgi:hypothetical protein